MVVLAASVITKTGKALVSRQFVDMTRIRIEGLLAAFPKLVGIEKQHTYVETENVRYVYQPIESLYLLLVTNKQSNILEDLETLRLLSKLVPEYSPALDEEGICNMAFELIFAFDEVICLGHKENLTVPLVKKYCEMDSHEEKLHLLVRQSKINDTKDRMKQKASEIDKSKIDKSRGDKGGFMSSGLGRLDDGFSKMGISGGGGGFGSGSVHGLGADLEYPKPKGPSSADAPAQAPAKGLGMQLGKTQRTNRFLESLKAEGEVILEDISANTSSTKASLAVVSTDPVTLSVEEKINVMLKRDGGLSNFEVQGTLSLQILSRDDGFIQVQIDTGDNVDFQFKTHPNINRELFSNQNILGLKDPSRPFPTSQTGDAAGLGLLRWRMQSTDESLVPLSINCWPSVSGRETYVSIEYEASSKFDLHNVAISIPLPAVRDPPSVRQVDGEWSYDSRRTCLVWSILLIDSSNRNGSMEFVVPAADSSAFFPINVEFTSLKTFAEVRVAGIVALKGGAPPKYSSKVQLLTDNYQVV
ncbi:hypothetical protein AMTRI_Chr07g28590 [Amborella trichopoda]|uniref:Coatomer subunit delta n=1 Tax=Amborella trichopoda TaxID=13333 RepID=W1NPB3_AMBTC|nr:coatomer subunit delta-2 [Amborella trichopoda]XP_020518171.1 coatomer subunit delta-2 [Amborella trichopoda]ERM98446.1 hypothetical protein AMTR_s00072p00138870 [Amborella trichopoda]|eukprot:XP_006833168.1 coatomer subunit delta-2 [Amborella trichopoda]